MSVSESREPDDGELIKAAFDWMSIQLKVCLPCKIVGVHEADDAVDVKPMVRMRIPNGDGVEETIEYPVIADVPLAFPRFGDWYVKAPIAVGDYVLCVFSDTSLDAYRQAGLQGVAVDPLDIRSHHISDAIAMPANIYATGGAVGSTGDHLVIGKKGSTTAIHLKSDGIELGNPGFTGGLDFVALASKVQAQLNALGTLLDTLGADMTALGSAVGVGATTAGAISDLRLGGWPANVAATKVKAE